MSKALALARFGRDQRIRKRSEFRGILNGGVRVVTPHCVFVVASRPMPTAASNRARLGLVVSRKVGGAVLRNRFKRLAREVFRKTSVQFPEDAEIVLIAKHWSQDLPESSLAAEWATAQERIFAALDRHRQKVRRRAVSTRGPAC